MFGNSTNGAVPRPNRPSAADVAQISTNLTQVIVSSDSSEGLLVIVNGQPLSSGAVESLSVEIIAPDDTNNSGNISAILSRYQTGPDGRRTQQASSLFPGTVELIGRGRRVLVSCPQEGSFDGLWLGLGLRVDGTSNELTGVQTLRLAVAPGLLDAKLTWSEDGTTEDLLPA